MAKEVEMFINEDYLKKKEGDKKRLYKWRKNNIEKHKKYAYEYRQRIKKAKEEGEGGLKLQKLIN